MVWCFEGLFHFPYFGLFGKKGMLVFRRSSMDVVDVLSLVFVSIAKWVSTRRAFDILRVDSATYEVGMLKSY